MDKKWKDLLQKHQDAQDAYDVVLDQINIVMREIDNMYPGAERDKAQAKYQALSDKLDRADRKEKAIKMILDKHQAG